MSKLVELNERIAAKSKELHDIFAAHPDLDMNEDEVKSIQQLNAELTDLGKERDQLQALADIDAKNRQVYDELHKPVKGMVHPTGATESDERPKELKSIGQQFVESAAFKGYDRMRRSSPVAELEIGSQLGAKATVDTTAWPIRDARTMTPFGAAIPGALRRPVVADLIPQGATDANAIIYLEETTTTNAAAFVAESGAKPESALAFTERTAPVRKIATVLPVTDELMADEPAMRAYVEARLRVFLDLAEETALLTGTNNTAPNFAGLYNVSGIQTQALGADPVPDAIYKAIVKIQTVAFLQPSGVVIHPNDWQAVRLLRTADGQYIWGNPSEEGPERIWGLPVVSTTAATENSAIVAAFDTAMQIFRKEGVSFAVSDQHSDFFITNKLMLRIEERLAFAVYRPSAVCTVTGI